MAKVGIIGIGKLGSSILKALSGTSFIPVAVFDLNEDQQIPSHIPRFKTAQQVADLAELLIITTQDDQIAEVDNSLSYRSGQMVIHCSGAHPGNLLSKAKREGALVGSLHPMQSFASAESDTNPFEGIYFSVESDSEKLSNLLAELANAIGAHTFSLTAEKKTIYHAASVITSNYSLALFDLAADLLTKLDIDREVAEKALLPLLKGTVQNIEQLGAQNSQTGPIARGDIATAEKQLQELEVFPEVYEVYKMLGGVMGSMAERTGKLSHEKAELLLEIFKGK